jgi:hypothetical protein
LGATPTRATAVGHLRRRFSFSSTLESTDSAGRIDVIGLAVGDDVLAEGVRERRATSGGPRLGQAQAALEGLAVCVDERYERDRRMEYVGRESGQAA